MAISNYLQKCDYRIGGLKPYIYLIHKDTLKLNFKAKGVEVSFKKTLDGDLYKVNGAMCVFNQDETYQNKYRFNNTLEVTINEQYKEPFFYGLRTLRTNEYYIIIEDKKGVQYLINAELYTNLNYEYNFSDTADVQNSVLLTWNNLSNYPLLIMEEKVETDKLLLGEECPYNLGQAFSLIMTHHNELKTKDDGVKATDIYIDDVDKLKRIEYLKESFTLNETYDGNMFRVTLSYSIPLDDNQFNWHYDLLEFENNRYTAVLRTTNDNYVICGIEKGLFPKYNIQTSEDDETPNMINITFEQLSQYPIIYTDDITQYRWVEDEPMCFGYDRYQMLVQQYSEDWGETWETTDPLVKKKGDLIEKDSSECKIYQWVDDGTYCKEETIEYVQYKETSLFVCENGNKYEKLQKYTSTDGKTYSPQDEYIKGDLIEENSKECSYVAIRWVDMTDGYMCFPVNEDLTEWREVEDVTTCVDYGSYKLEKEYITNNGNIYYESGEERVGELVKQNDYNCGWRMFHTLYKDNYCTSAITDTTLETHTFIGLSGDLSDDTYNYGVLTIKGQGTYTLNIQPISIYKDYGSDFYLFASRLDEDVIYTATTSTSSSVGNSYYNKCVYYGGYKYGNWTYTVNDDEEHKIQLGYLIKTNKNVSVKCLFYLTRELQPNTMYERVELKELINVIDGEYIYDTPLFNMYLPIEYNSCDCGYVGYDWKCGNELGYEYICGYLIGDSYDSTSMYEVWREYEKCKGTETGNIEYRNPITSCTCGYIDMITKTEEGYISLTRRQHSNGVYIDIEYEGASDELYDYRANITYSGNACLGDEIIWTMTSYEIIQEYIEEEVSEITQIPLLFTLTDNSNNTIGYFDVNGNVYLNTFSTAFLRINNIDDMIYLYTTMSCYIIMPKYSVESFYFSYTTWNCTNNNYTAGVTLYEYGKNNGISLRDYNGETFNLPNDNTASIHNRVGSTCSLGMYYKFNLNDERLFDIPCINTYEVINDKRILINNNINFSGYTYRTIQVEYNENDSSTYIEDENGFRYYKIIEQFSLDGNTYYDYANGYAIKGDMIGGI